MGDYSAHLYEGEAAELPAELQAAVAGDLGLTPAEYLAQADAAYAASSVVEALAAQGVDVLAYRLQGTELVVNVPAPADVAAVEAANAIAEIGEPQAEAALPETAPGEARFLADLVGGQGYFSVLSEEYISLCSVAFNGTNTANNLKQFLTAGHCRESGQWDNGRMYELVQSRPGVRDAAGPVLGQPSDSTFHLGDGVDSGLVTTNTNAFTPVPRVGTWGSTANNAPVTSGAQVAIRDYAQAVVNQPICRSGRTSGWQCGTVEEVDYDLSVGPAPIVQVNTIISDFCALPGDSGGSVLSGSYAIGLLSAGTYEDSCDEQGRLSAAFPLVAGDDKSSVATANPTWEISVAVSNPVITFPAAGAVVPEGATMTGTVPSSTTRYSVRVVVDGSTTLTAPVASDGTWSVPLTGVSKGLHSYSVTALYGTGISKSAATTGSFAVGVAPTVSRIAGVDRYAGAVAIADAAFPGGSADVVYVATGANYPDALSAGPAAVHEGGPLLLVQQNAVPADVAAKISALAPSRIVIVGGPNSVGPAVETALADLLADVPDAAVERIAGADRYSGSRTLVETVFETAPHAYAATGTNFPDALSAGGAAGSLGEPVVLVNGPTASADADTLAFFKALSTDAITIVGGVNSVSPGVESSLRTGVPASVDRVAGDNRYLASIALNRSAFSTASTVYLATGQNFPDALAGGVLAGMNDAPLYVVPGDCVPRGVISDIYSLGATKVVLLGGPNSLTPAVAALTPCTF
jgi:putative cell wall-binding protein